MFIAYTGTVCDFWLTMYNLAMETFSNHRTHFGQI